MDVHQASLAGASVAQAPRAAVPSLGAIGTRQCALAPLRRTRPSTAHHVGVVSAAGPWGSWLSRSLTKKDSACGVVAPSRLPNTAGDRVTTARRDAMPLARLARAGERPAVSGPPGEADALRALPRAREETLHELQAAQCRRTACLLRQASRDTGRAPGGPAPLRWLAAVVGPPPVPPMVFQAYVRAVTAHTERLPRLAHARQAPGTSWRVPPVVEALPALRGVPCTGAVPTVAALGDLPRCEKPRARRHCLGRIPAEDAPGARRRQGAMTKAGNPPARRARGAGAWG